MKSLMWVALLGIVSLTACDKDEEADIIFMEERAFSGVDERLWPFFIRFEERAAERGIAIDLISEGITGIIEEIDDENVAGSCNFSRRAANHVIIDAEFWERASILNKEFVVFHELGHCSLLRDHREGADANGKCLSMMRSGLEECRDNYSALTRSVYWDELFDPAFANDLNP